MQVEDTMGFRGIAGRLLLLLALALPPLLAGLDAGDCEFHMEVLALASSQETWFRQQADPGTWVLPTWNGAPRVNKPPLVVWINLLSWTGLPPDTPVETLIMRARYVAAGAGLLTLLATLWAGASLGGSRLGFAAAAVLATTLLFVRQVRLASYDTYLMAFTALAVASGLWTLHTDQPGWRRLCGWLLAGVALGAAVLAKGPLALLLVGAPLLGLTLFTPRHRQQWPGFLLMFAVAAVVTLPWYFFILHHIPEAGNRMATEFIADRKVSKPPWYYLGLLGLVLPWCLWLAAGLWEGLRRRMEFRSALIWFLAIFLLLSLHEAKQQRYIVPILPAASLLIALAWLQPGRQRLGNIQAGFMGVSALAYGVFGAGQPWLLAHGLLKRPELEQLPTWLLAAVAPVLLLLTLAVYRQGKQGRREAALWLTAGWMSLATTPAVYGYAHSYHSRYEHHAIVEQIRDLTRDQPLYHLASTGAEPRYERPNPKFLLYARRIVPGLSMSEATQVNHPAWLTAPVYEEVDRSLQMAGWIPVLDYRDQSIPRRLYRRG